MRNLRLAVLGLLLPYPLLAQNGDKAGEIQHPLPASIIVPPAPILTAREEMRTFRVKPGFRVELVATDPVVADPVALAFGPDGRIWVVEMRGFMPDPDGTNERAPVSDVTVLSDSHGDGVMDRSTPVAQGLILPRALGLVDGGILIGEPPHLWYQRGDSRTEVAKDYGNVNNPEHNANGLMWAMDNWIYSANLTSRYRYEGDGRFRRETTITRGQWGITQDDWGRIYYNSNSDPLRVDVIPSAYLRRNPGFMAGGANVQLVPATLPVFPGRVTPGINRGYKTLDAAGKMYAVTAACGPVIYRGGLFPAEFRDTAFICEPAGNLIKRIALTEAEGSVLGANAYRDTEFLTSTDERFRPVNLFNGPDGALYIVDMYRGLIQHRIYLTSYLRQQTESRGLQKGLHYGRIFRVVPVDAPPAADRWRSWKRLEGAAPAALVQALADPNGWTRDTAQRLLVERRSPAATALLRQLAVDGAAPATARLQALWTLDGIGPGSDAGLDRATVLAALGDAEPHVCAAAIRLSEHWLQSPGDDGVFEAVTRLAAHAAPTVRLQLALSLGEARRPAGDAVLRRLVAQAGSQPFLTDAVVSGLGGREVDFVRGLAQDGGVGAGSPAAEAVAAATSAVLADGKPAPVAAVLAVAGDAQAPEWVRLAVVQGVRRFLPHTDDGRLFPASLTTEPKALVALAAQPNTALGRAAAEVLPKLRWPGKPGGDQGPPPLGAADQELFEKGRAQYAALCAACHQPAGQGLAGLAPPLAYSRWVLGDPRILARIVLCGKAQENMTMPPWRNALNDQQIAAVLTYIRRSWGHEESPVPVRIVKSAREDTAARTEPWSDPDLEDLQQDLGPYRPRRARQ